jgi:hypothetical protein
VNSLALDAVVAAAQRARDRTARLVALLVVADGDLLRALRHSMGGLFLRLFAAAQGDGEKVSRLSALPRALLASTGGLGKGILDAPRKNQLARVSSSVNPNFPFLFPVFFVLVWLAITSALGFLSGWYSLAKKFPNRQEKPLLQLKWQSGVMGKGASMRGLLNLSVCESGLRVGIVRLFGLFCRDFFVPWNELRVSRKEWHFFKAAELEFGNPPVGTLSIAAHIADRLAGSALGRWPEAGPFPREADRQVFSQVAMLWAAMTFAASLLFVLVPRVAMPDGPFPPVSIAIGFPALVFGIAAFYRYLSRTKR